MMDTDGFVYSVLKFTVISLEYTMKVLVCGTSYMIPIDKVVHGQAISNANHRGGETSQNKIKENSWMACAWQGCSNQCCDKLSYPSMATTSQP